MTYFAPVTHSADLETPRFPVRLVAHRTGLTPHVLRAWERRYGVVTPVRSEGGQRLYSQLDVERLALLRRLTERGHAIGRIASLPLDALIRLDEEMPQAPPRSSPTVQPAGETAREFAAAALTAVGRLDAPGLQAVLERAAVTLGVPEFLDGVVATTLEDIGRGWSEQSVSVAQEHLATTVFRRVLGWLLGVYEVAGSAPRMVVATSPGQVHELGALLVAVSAAAEGWGVVYLGADLPVADLVTAARQTGARVVGLSLVYLPEGEEILPTLKALRAGLPRQVSLLLGGAAASSVRREAEAAGLTVVESLAELRTLLRRLSETE